MKTVTRKLFCEWCTFTTDTETYTQETFEDLVGDEFEAMMFENEDQAIPSYIWTTNFVCIIKRSTRMYNDISVTKIPRNPACE
ncbi:hypothetical protein CR194_16130 [Salipaludibacillus keqinensis]|uniref:Uncharacterized protein n=1 Tax=Salipaludibacillus keqinensis TaxID=2045207 RepID=A0A323TAV0_9BACI|nr:hypothetical protein [Salipaludibacillus keqinensis]PYZ92359.1 hypothetical protein CR194_16130 [Salipaludibacillus keqinensis]